MESNSLKNQVHLSKSAAEYLIQQCEDFEDPLCLGLESRGLVSIKGKGEMETFFLRRFDHQRLKAESRRSTRVSIASIGSLDSPESISRKGGAFAAVVVSPLRKVSFSTDTQLINEFDRVDSFV